IPRAFSSGALSIWSYATKVPPFVSAITFVSAAVSVVLPWSTWPIVPTLTCGLLRSNFSFDTTSSSDNAYVHGLRPFPTWFAARTHVHLFQDSSIDLILHDRVRDRGRHFQILLEFHGKRR